VRMGDKIVLGQGFQVKLTANQSVNPPDRPVTARAGIGARAAPVRSAGYADR
jgi:hypothetical protein